MSSAIHVHDLHPAWPRSWNTICENSDSDGDAPCTPTPTPTPTPTVKYGNSIYLNKDLSQIIGDNIHADDIAMGVASVGDACDCDKSMAFAVIQILSRIAGDSINEDLVLYIGGSTIPRNIWYCFTSSIRFCRYPWGDTPYLSALVSAMTTQIQRNARDINWMALSLHANSCFIPFLETHYVHVDFPNLFLNTHVASIATSVMCTRFLEYSKSRRQSPRHVQSDCFVSISGYITSDIIPFYLDHLYDLHWGIISASANPFLAPVLLRGIEINKIDWSRLSANPNPAAVNLLLQYPNKINWSYMSRNPHPRALALLCSRPSEIDWFAFSWMQHFTYKVHVHHLNAVDINNADMTVFDVIERNSSRVYWNGISGCRHCPALGDILHRWAHVYHDTYDWHSISCSHLPEYVPLIREWIDVYIEDMDMRAISSHPCADILPVWGRIASRLDWPCICASQNPRLADFLRAHTSMFINSVACWEALSLNSNPALTDFLLDSRHTKYLCMWNISANQNPHVVFAAIATMAQNIEWNILAANPVLFHPNPILPPTEPDPTSADAVSAVQANIDDTTTLHWSICRV